MYFVGEDRDIERKCVTFFCLDRVSGKTMWRDVSLHESWWTGIEKLHKHVAFFHEYVSPDLPGHKKIYAVELATGKMLWFNDELEFLFVNENSVYASKVAGDRRLFFELDLGSGASLRELDISQINTIKNAGLRGSEIVEFPSGFQQNANDASFIKAELEHALRQAHSPSSVEYLRKNGKLVVGYYDDASATEGAGMLDQNIVILDEDTDKVVYEDRVNTHLSVSLPDMFFGMGKYVYYIKGKKTVTALKIE